MADNADIKGLQQAQATNLQAINALKPSGAVGEAIQKASAYIFRLVLAITHVATGALRASHRLEVAGEIGRIFIDPGAVNPRSGQKVNVYAFIEHERGGEHAFYERAVREGGSNAQRIARRIIEGALP